MSDPRPRDENVRRNYGLGLRIVLVTIVVASPAALAIASRWPQRPGRAAEDLEAAARPVGAFQLVERSGGTITDADLSQRVAIASFIFTRCPLSCPRISSVMQGLQSRLKGTGVLLVSISVDPDHDTPEVLKEYAKRYGAQDDRWWFLTGSKSLIYSLVRDRFLLSVMPAPGSVGADDEAIIHSDRLALIDHGQIVGLFESTDSAALDALVARARRRALPAWVLRLPSVNAALNGLSACLLLAGWLLIRGRPRLASTDPAPDRQDSADLERDNKPAGVMDGVSEGTSDPVLSADVTHEFRVKAHIACMILAVVTSALFLGCYLCYHYYSGSMPFSQGGVSRVIYLAILMSHTVLATGSVPLIVATLWRAWRTDWRRHVAVASLTYPIWLYVAVTGVVVYLMLYHLPVWNAGASTIP